MRALLVALLPLVGCGLFIPEAGPRPDPGPVPVLDGGAPPDGCEPIEVLAGAAVPVGYPLALDLDAAATADVGITFEGGPVPILVDPQLESRVWFASVAAVDSGDLELGYCLDRGGDPRARAEPADIFPAYTDFESQAGTVTENTRGTSQIETSPNGMNLAAGGGGGASYTVDGEQPVPSLSVVSVVRLLQATDDHLVHIDVFDERRAQTDNQGDFPGRYVSLVTNTGDGLEIYESSPESSARFQGVAMEPAVTLEVGRVYRFELQVDVDEPSARVFVDDVQVLDHPLTHVPGLNPGAPIPLVLGVAGANFSGGQTNEVELRAAFIRPVVRTEPIVTLAGADE